MRKKVFFTVLALVFLLAAGVAQATPQYNAQTGQACTTCHNPSFSLTDTGKVFKASGYKWPLPASSTEPSGSAQRSAPQAGVSSSEFKDMKGHWAAAQVEELADKKIIAGYKDLTFRPEREITAGEFSALLQRTLPAGHSGQKYLDGYYGVKTVLDRGMAIKIALSAFELGDMGVMSFENWRNLLSFYGDRDEIPSEAAPSVAWATKVGLVRGYPDGTFGAHRKLTRAEAATLVASLLKTL